MEKTEALKVFLIKELKNLEAETIIENSFADEIFRYREQETFKDFSNKLSFIKNTEYRKGKLDAFKKIFDFLEKDLEN
jgi:hypothetical protein